MNMILVVAHARDPMLAHSTVINPKADYEFAHINREYRETVN